MSSTTVAPGDSRLADRLRREIRGDVLFSRADRGRYATDASIYQVEPIGVIVPEEIGDVAAVLSIAREEGVPVLPRGGGTSQCGQTVNRALVIDCSKHLRRVLHVDPDARTALVEPGLVLGHLNAALRATRLVLSGRSLDACPLHDRWHGRQQLLRLEVDPLRADGRQRTRDRRDPGRRHAAHVRPAAGQSRRRHAQRHRRADPAAAGAGRDGSRGDRRAVSLAASPRRRLQHRRADTESRARRSGESGSAAGGIGRHARLFRGNRAHAASDQTAQGAGHLPVPDFSQRHGGDAAHRAARPGGGGAGRSHHDRSRPRYPDLPRARSIGC